MELQLVTFEQAKALKELGFPQDTRTIDTYYYDDGAFFDGDSGDYEDEHNVTEAYVAPSLELTSKWLREEKKIHICPIYYSSKTYKQEWYSLEVNQHQINDDEDYTSYEEALSDGINIAIEILKENNYEQSSIKY